MLVACALLVVMDEASAQTTASASGQISQPIGIFSRLLQTKSQNKWGLLLLVWFLVSALSVPEVIDRALTGGVLASITCIWIAMQIGKRAANSANALLHWLLMAWLIAALVSSTLAVLQYLDLAHELVPWVNQPRSGDAFANLRQRNQFASLTSIGVVALFGLAATMQSISKRYASMMWCALALLAAGLACSVL